MLITTSKEYNLFQMVDFEVADGASSGREPMKVQEIVKMKVQVIVQMKVIVKMVVQLATRPDL